MDALADEVEPDGGNGYDGESSAKREYNHEFHRTLHLEVMDQLNGRGEDEKLGDDVEGADCKPFRPLCPLPSAILSQVSKAEEIRTLFVQLLGFV